MEKITSLSGRTYRHFMHDSLRRNSSLLIFSQAVLAGSMFLFWVINAHLFTASEVGLATSFISFGLLVSTFTNLGLPNTIIRFLPTSRHKAGLFVSALGLITLASLIGYFAALLVINFLTPKLSFIHSSFGLELILFLLVWGSAVSGLLDGAMMAFRKGEYVFAKALLTNLPRIFLPFAVVAAGVKGMAGIYVATLLLGIALNFYNLFSKLLKISDARPALAEIRTHKAYAVSNYFGGMFGILPATLVPVIILSRLGPTAAAYYYMPAQIVLFLSLVCSSVSQALISETSQTNDEVQQRFIFRKAFIHLYQILIPIAVGLCIIGWPILHIYGRAYADNGYIPLLILLGSGMILGINWLGDTWLNIRKESRNYFLMNAFNSLAIVTAVYLLSPHGLIAAALGYLLGQILSAIVYLAIFGRNQLLPIGTSFKTSS